MRLNIKNISIIEKVEDLQSIPKGKHVINCINAHSYNIAQKDPIFSNAFLN